VPTAVSGPAQLQATIRDGDEVIALDYVGVLIALDTTADERYLAMFRFDGFVQQPAGGVTLSLWTDGCQNEAARQFFSLRGNTYWHGFLLVPRDLTGPACAVAYTGSSDDPDRWREAQVAVNVLADDDEDARGIVIGYPPPGSPLQAGRSYPVYGVAYNAPGGEVSVTYLLDNGRLVGQGVATTDLYGYWEVNLTVPLDAEGAAFVQATMGIPGADEYAQSQNPINIVAAGE
jgi:hypothetical protein